MNRPHVDVTPTPANIGAGLRSGRYIAQVHRRSDPGTVLYASAAAAPTDLADWFSAEPGGFFTFSASATCPCWARTAEERTAAGNAEAFAVLAIADFKA